VPTIFTNVATITEKRTVYNITDLERHEIYAIYYALKKDCDLPTPKKLYDMLTPVMEGD
jgi:hypothetical protein